MPRPSLLEGVARCLQTTDTWRQDSKEPLGEWLTSLGHFPLGNQCKWKKIVWEMDTPGVSSSAQTFTYKQSATSQGIYPHRANYVLWRNTCQHQFCYSQTRIKLNETPTHYGQRNISDNSAKLQPILLWGKLCTKDPFPPQSHANTFLGKINEILRLTGICIHIKPVHVLRSIVNQSSTMTENITKEMPNTTYDMAICNVKNRTTNVLRGANWYGVLEGSDDQECANKIQNVQFDNMRE